MHYKTNEPYCLNFRMEVRERETIFLCYFISSSSDQNMIADVKNNKAFIYIEDKNPIGDVTFPSQPIIVSLREYEEFKDDVISLKPTPGGAGILYVCF